MGFERVESFCGAAGVAEVRIAFAVEQLAEAILRAGVFRRGAVAARELHVACVR